MACPHCTMITDEDGQHFICSRHSRCIKNNQSKNEQHSITVQGIQKQFPIPSSVHVDGIRTMSNVISIHLL